MHNNKHPLRSAVENMTAEFNTLTQKMVMLQNLVAESSSTCLSLP